MNKEKLIVQLFIGKICDEIGTEKTERLLKESRQEIEDALKKLDS
jgi:hypothetical protein